MPAEITSTDTMMYVREVPWHGLGTRVETAPNSIDAIRLAGIDWTVDGKPVYDNRGNEIPGYKANTRSSDGSVLGIVSNRYKIIQNKDAFAFTDALLHIDDCEVHYETAGSLKGGKIVWLLAKLANQDILGDEVTPYLCFRNTHDGKGSIKVCMTPIRVVCNNTLNIALEQATRMWTTRHIGNLDTKMEEAKETLGLARDYMVELTHTADILSSVKISDAELENVLDTMYPITAETSENLQPAVNVPLGTTVRAGLRQKLPKTFSLP